jgi:hypothetical protein
MTTRHVSAETDYPFEPLLTEAEAEIVGGILDLYFVVQSPADREIPQAESSSGGGCEKVDRLVYLSEYQVISGITRFTFTVREGPYFWDVMFDVPNTGGETGQVNNFDGGNVNAVLVYNTDNIIDTGSGLVLLPVEPSRAQFHTEQVDRLCFYNISRCAGEEDQEASSLVLCVEGSSSLAALAFEDGYNTEVVFESSELVFTGRQGAGKGRAPDFGDTEPSCSEEPGSVLDNIITTVNGIAPNNGDIPLVVSGDLGTQRVAGRITIFPRF